MALTRDFKATVKIRADRDPEFRRGLLEDGVELVILGEFDAGKTLIRDYINATIGFNDLAERLGKDVKSLMRMFSAQGNPTAENFVAVLVVLQEYEGVQFGVTSTERAAA